jgi:hypothetical protein
MISDRDIYGTANIMIREFGSEARLQASLRADEFLEQGDLDGQRLWLRIIKAIDELTTSDRGDALLN